MSSATSVLPYVPMAAVPPVATASASRFTLDGDSGLEAHLAGICESVGEHVGQLIPGDRLEGILLGGGYGRGEGGVLHTAQGDHPYNDLEFYVLVRGSTLINEWRYRASLDRLAHSLSVPAGVEVEFKLISIASLRRNPVTMFSYDLVRGHRQVSGPADLLAGCAHHEKAGDIPLSEAIRLLMNRGTGLLFSRQRLEGASFAREDADFVERNLAKAKLALGDAVLTAFRLYHWSSRERFRRLGALAVTEEFPWLEIVRADHAAGLDFKLRPYWTTRSAPELREDLRRISQLMCRVWLWLESRRLQIAFRSPINYALHPATKCPETPVARNWLVNARRFGAKELITTRALRYPRERLLRALPVLLWQPAMLGNRRVRQCLQRQLRTSAGDRTGLLDAYIRLWEIFR